MTAATMGAPVPTTTGSAPPVSPRRLARVAGVLYLLVGVLSAPVILWVRPGVRVAGDAAATAAAVTAGERVLRLGFVADLGHLVSFILLALVLRVLLRHVHAHAAAAMVTFVALAVGIMSLNLVNHMAAVVVATGSVATTGADPRLALLFLELHEIGFRIAEVFFGLWLLPLGYLVHRSGWFPRPLGALLAVGGVGYMVLAATVPLLGGVSEAVDTAMAAPAAVGEVWMVGYLLVRGVRGGSDRAGGAA